MPHKHDGHDDNYDKVTKKQMKKVLFISQNMRGIKSINRLEELFYVMSTRNVLAICLQETWPYGNEILENSHYGLIISGLSRIVMNGNRGSQPVAIALSQEGVIAWKAAGSDQSYTMILVLA